MKILEVVIPEGDMPESCESCKWVKINQAYEDIDGCWWNHNVCGLNDMTINGRIDIQRHPDCPLVERKKEDV